MSVRQETLRVSTPGRGLIELTDGVAQAVRRSAMTGGVATVMGE